MFPRFSMNDAPDSMIGNAIHFGYVGLWHTLIRNLANLSNLIFGHFVHPVMFSVYSRIILSAPAFLDHIGHVVLVCAQKQMGRIYTFSIVASMANKHTLWNWAACQLIGKPVSASRPGFGNGEVTIPLPVYVARPAPTLVGPAFINVRPETFFWRWPVFWKLTRTLVTARGSFGGPGKFTNNLFATNDAMTNFFHSLLQAKVRCLALFRLLSREHGLSTKQRTFTRKIKRPTNSLDGFIIPPLCVGSVPE